MRFFQKRLSTSLRRSPANCIAESLQNKGVGGSWPPDPFQVVAQALDLEKGFPDPVQPQKKFPALLRLLG